MNLVIISLVLTIIRSVYLIHLLLPSSKYSVSGLLFKATIGIGIIWGIDSLLLLGWMLVAGSINSEFIIIELIGTGLITGGYYYVKRNHMVYWETDPICVSQENRLVYQNTYYHTLNIITSLVISISLVYFLYNSLVTGADGLFDASAIWNMRARMLLASGEDWKTSFELMRQYMSPWTHVDYPLLLSNTIARYWGYLGQHLTLIPSIISFLFTFMTVILLYGSVSLIRNKLQGLLAILVLCGSRFIEYGTWQYADVPLSFYFLATLVLLNLAFSYQTPSSRALALMGSTMGLAAWTKNEGTLFVIASLSAYGFFCFTGKVQNRNTLKELYSILIGLIPILLGTLYFKYALAPQNDLISSGSLAVAIEKLTDINRYLQILNGFQHLLGNFLPYILLVYLGIASFMIFKKLKQGMLKFIFFSLCLLLSAFHLLILPFFLTACLAFQMLPIERNYSRSLATSALTVSLMFIGYFFIYLITPYDLGWHINTSMDRLIIQLLPSFIFIVFLIPVPLEFKVQHTSSIFQILPIFFKFALRGLLMCTALLVLALPVVAWYYFAPYQADGFSVLYPTSQLQPSPKNPEIHKKVFAKFEVSGDGDFHKIRIPISNNLNGKKIGFGINLRHERILEVKTIRFVEANGKILQDFNFHSLQRLKWEFFNGINIGEYQIHPSGIEELKALNHDESRLKEWFEFLSGSQLTFSDFTEHTISNLTKLEGKVFKNRNDFEAAMRFYDIYNRHAGFQLTDQSFAEIEKENFPKDVINQLSSSTVKNQLFDHEENFWRVVKQNIEMHEGDNYSLDTSLLLKHANIIEWQRRKIIRNLFRMAAYKQKANPQDLDLTLVSPVLDFPEQEPHFVEIHLRIRNPIQ